MERRDLLNTTLISDFYETFYVAWDVRGSIDHKGLYVCIKDGLSRHKD